MNSKQEITIREAKPNEFSAIGALMVDVYSSLEGFPDKEEQPEYYEMLANIGSVTDRPKTKLLVALSPDGKILGGVVYFGDMKYYGSGGTATSELHASGFRLLGVAPSERGNGVGKLLTKACIRMAREDQNHQVIIHSTESMRIAWGMYIKLGFNRSEDLDFMQEELPVFGFRMMLDD